jgi:hypothetical protein
MKNRFNKSTTEMNHSSSVAISAGLRYACCLWSCQTLCCLCGYCERRYAVLFVAAMQPRSKQSADKSSERRRQDRIKTCIQRTYRCNPMSRASADDRDRLHDLCRARYATARYPGQIHSDQWPDKEQCDYTHVLIAYGLSLLMR